MNADEIVAELERVFAEVPRPGIPKNYVPSGKLGNPGWDEFTYHSALVLAEQLPGHVKRAFDSPQEELPRLFWHLSDSERLGVFSKAQLEMLLGALDLLEAEHAPVVRKLKEGARLKAVRERLERLARERA